MNSSRVFLALCIIASLSNSSVLTHGGGACCGGSQGTSLELATTSRASSGLASTWTGRIVASGGLLYLTMHQVVPCLQYFASKLTPNAQTQKCCTPTHPTEVGHGHAHAAGAGEHGHSHGAQTCASPISANIGAPAMNFSPLILGCSMAVAVIVDLYNHYHPSKHEREHPSLADLSVGLATSNARIKELEGDPKKHEAALKRLRSDRGALAAMHAQRLGLKA